MLRCAENTCCKSMFHVFQVFHRYLAIVSYGCCKSRSRCCIYGNGCTCMLQRSVFNVSSMFLNVCCKCVLSGCCICFYRYVASVLSRYCVCFAMVFKCFLGVFFFKCFRSTFQVLHLFSYVCCKCCISMFQKKIGCCISLVAFLAAMPQCLLLRASVEHLVFLMLVIFGTTQETYT
jgi:hypothetical protein